ARVVRVGESYAQLRLAEPVVAARGDRVVLRRHTTVGGGVVLDPKPPRVLDPKRLATLETGDNEAIVRAIVHAPVTGPELQARARKRPPSSRRKSLPRAWSGSRTAGSPRFSNRPGDSGVSATVSRSRPTCTTAAWRRSAH